MEGFLSPSGEISCPRLSFCMQHIKMKWEFGQTHAFPLFTVGLSSAKQKKEKKQCSAAAVITIWKRCVVSTELVMMVAGFCLYCFLFDHLMTLLSLTLRVPSPEGSVHSNDSLSDSSPGVPTQVVQPVQTTAQVSPLHIYKPYQPFEPIGAGYTQRDGCPTKFYLTLWLYSPAEVSVAGSVTGSQENSDRPHQQPAAGAH